MAAGIHNVLRKFVLFIDGTDFRGDCDSFKLPTLSLQTEMYRGGGMDIPVEIDLGMSDALTFEVRLTSITAEALRHWGIVNRQRSFTLRGSLVTRKGNDNEQAISRLKAQFRAKFKEADIDAFEPGGKTSVNLTGTGDYYRLEIDGKIVHEIDAINCIRKINGVDELANERSILGITVT